MRLAEPPGLRREDVQVIYRPTPATRGRSAIASHHTSWMPIPARPPDPRGLPAMAARRGTQSCVRVLLLPGRRRRSESRGRARIFRLCVANDNRKRQSTSVAPFGLFDIGLLVVR